MESRSDPARSLIAASRDGFWAFDDAGRTTYTNARTAELLGRTPEEMATTGLLDVAYDDAGRAELHGFLARLSEAPEHADGIDQVELVLGRTDGTPLRVEASVSPVRGDDGRRTDWLLRMTPRHGQGGLAETLEASRHQLVTAQRLANIGSWEWDTQSGRISWSDQMFRIVGAAPQSFEPTYERFLDCLHPDDRERVDTEVRAGVDAASDFAWEGRVVQPDGNVRWVSGLGTVEGGRPGEPERMEGTVQDVTDLVLADQLAAEANRRLHLLQAMATAANQTNSLQEALELARVGLPAYSTWHAVAAFLTEGEGHRVVDLTTAAGLPDPDLGLAALSAANRSVEETPCPGLESTHTLVAIPVVVEDEVECVVELLADESPIDDHARALIDQISAQLAHVAHRERSARDLAEARDQAMEASRLKSEFLAMMSHEIRTPMNGVIGLNDLLLQTRLDAHQLRLTEGLKQAGFTLLAIINDILDFSLIEAGKLELKAADFDVRDVFEAAAAELSTAAHDKGLELVVACDPDVPRRLRGDATRLRQVLTNLGSNAIKFTDAGEVSIRGHLLAEDGEQISLKVDVVDSGVGMDPGLQSRLFEAFTMADPSTTRQQGGTGLGLAISARLIEALGGEVEVESTPGAGSAFRFSATFERGQSPTPIDDVTLLRGRRALVVDDNATSRVSLGDRLAAWGIRTVLVGSVEEALAAMDEHTTFDVALINLSLPDGDGLSLSRAMDASAGEAPRRLLLVPGHHVATATAAAATAGITRTLPKPVRHSELHAALEAALTPAPTPAVAPDEEGASIAGLRVLVVEDNDVNQLVAIGLLENLGCEVDVVIDGVEAVAALTGDHGYAAVLMDCRMPRLDGYDATRRVRAAEPEGVRVPIIAMTASATEGERERCLAAGMDDFLTKPVEADRVRAVVSRWLRDPTGETHEEAPGATFDEDGLPVLDRHRVGELEELVKDGVSLFDRSSGNFMAGADGHVAAIRDAIAAGDPDALVTASHRLKGSAANIGLPRVANAADRLELLGDGGTTRGADELLARLEAALFDGLRALKEHRGG
ncbi:response regulator [Nocardioides taihuensis]|uniref:histidine kinase n=1 Tax=Nocardioides taihuensis TaxID=1835606 RepID=A0ABW0BLM5_9ACTN